MSPPRPAAGPEDVARGAWLVTAAQAATAAGKAVGTVWSWASRGRITPVGWVDGHPRYDLAQVIHVEWETRKRPNPGSASGRRPGSVQA